ncbi:hypothetical protein Scep_009690 [Stephania cephalantha]|uniref:Uncharacterized protein n=1 Tax=Stephania cephalantha TaxID=152367 RepID=A0AAP0JUB6_9MAGN
MGRLPLDLSHLVKLMGLRMKNSGDELTGLERRDESGDTPRVASEPGNRVVSILFSKNGLCIGWLTTRRYADITVRTRNRALKRPKTRMRLVEICESRGECCVKLRNQLELIGLVNIACLRCLQYVSSSVDHITLLRPKQGQIYSDVIYSVAFTFSKSQDSATV